MIRVGILRGGTNDHYKASLETGGVALAHLDRSIYRVVDLFVDREGMLHSSGVPINLSELSSRVDVVFNALHGHDGEDGKISGIFRNLGIPFVASSPLSSAIFLNKRLAKEYFESLGIKTPGYLVITREEFEEMSHEEIIRSVTYSITPPWVLKPLSGTLGATVLYAHDRFDLIQKLGFLFDTEESVLIEEKVTGNEISIGVIESFRGKDHYTSLPIGCVETPDGKTLCVARLSPDDRASIESIAERIFDGHKGYHYGTIDLIMTRRGPVVLEVNDQPHFGIDSPFGKSLDENGISWKEFLDHHIRLALNKK